MIKIGVILSGCGVQDGSEVSEAVLTFLALEKSGVQVLALAPDVEIATTVNHYTGAEMRMDRTEARHVLPEAARITRGKIQALGEVAAQDLDAIVLVGGYGAVKNLCTYERDGLRATVNPDVKRLISEMHELSKPIGAMCIAPVVVALALHGQRDGHAPLIMTIGDAHEVAGHLDHLGVRHQDTRVDQVCFDRDNMVVSTPAFMLGQSAAEVESGINKLVEIVVGLCKEMETTYQGKGA